MTIRDKILKAGSRTELVDVPFWDVKIEMRGQTVQQQYTILDKVRDSDGEIDGMRLAVETILVCSYEPGTENLVFDPADKDTLLQADAQSFNIMLAAANRAAGFESEGEVEGRLKGTSPDVPSTT
jgi:hypothetical protein